MNDYRRGFRRIANTGSWKSDTVPQLLVDGYHRIAVTLNVKTFMAQRG